MNKYFRRIWFTLFFGAVAAISTPVAHSQAPAQAQGKWIPLGTGDYPGRDWTSSYGLKPEDAKCTPDRAGQVAFCWDGVKYHNNFERRDRPWCIYKTIHANEVQSSGANIAATYVCQPGTVDPPPAANQNLSAAWVHSMDPNFTGGDWVIINQEGQQVTLAQSSKQRGQWVTLICRGPIVNSAMRLQCSYPGNPYGYAPFVMEVTISRDRNHLDGRITTQSGQGATQETHYSRRP